MKEIYVVTVWGDTTFDEDGNEDGIDHEVSTAFTDVETARAFFTDLYPKHRCAIGVVPVDDPTRLLAEITDWPGR